MTSTANTESSQTQTTPNRRFPPLRIADTGKVRLGGQGPIFRQPAIKDTGKVRVGGQGPIFR